MRSGRCQCGRVVFECAETPLALYACHCSECRKQSASAFGMSFQVPRASLRVVAGRPKVWQRVAGSGNRVDCFFCGDCGGRLWHENSGSPETATVKAGALDEPVDFSTATHIWTQSKLPGIEIPDGAQSFEGEPGQDAGLSAPDDRNIQGIMEMNSYSAEAKTENASRYLQQLCKHWSHKFEVTFDPQHGRIPFDADTVCLLDAKEDRLDMRLEGRDAERVAHLTGVVSDHLKRFAFREELAIDWHEGGPR